MASERTAAGDGFVDAPTATGPSPAAPPSTTGRRSPTEATLPDEGYEFYLCLSHDVDRPYKTYQGLYYGVTERSWYHFATLSPRRNPYWQFRDIMSLEADLGVRSTFFFLDEQRLFRDRPAREWVSPESWKLYTGRYDVRSPAIRAVVGDLADGGWEVGLHGSFDSYDDPDRLRAEKKTLESVLSGSVRGVRQHHLNLARPDTWSHHRDLGFEYDASFGSNHAVGFDYGRRPIRPFDDEFVVFPLTVMDAPLMETTDDLSEAWETCSSLVSEARDAGGVMTVDWHPRVFSERDFPGYRQLYRTLIATAQEAGAWVGPLGDLYEKLEDDR